MDDNKKEEDLVRCFEERILPHQQRFSSLIFEFLFEHYPHLKELFINVDLLALKQKVVDTLSYIIQRLNDDADEITDLLSALGHQHHQYGATADGFAAFGTAVLLALASTDESQLWTAELHSSWNDLLKNISAEMMLGMGAEQWISSVHFISHKELRKLLRMRAAAVAASPSASPTVVTTTAAVATASDHAGSSSPHSSPVLQRVGSARLIRKPSLLSEYIASKLHTAAKADAVASSTAVDDYVDNDTDTVRCSFSAIYGSSEEADMLASLSLPHSTATAVTAAAIDTAEDVSIDGNEYADIYDAGSEDDVEHLNSPLRPRHYRFPDAATSTVDAGVASATADVAATDDATDAGADDAAATVNSCDYQLLVHYYQQYVSPHATEFNDSFEKTLFSLDPELQLALSSVDSPLQRVIQEYTDLLLQQLMLTTMSTTSSTSAAATKETETTATTESETAILATVAAPTKETSTAADTLRAALCSRHVDSNCASVRAFEAVSNALLLSLAQSGGIDAWSEQLHAQWSAFLCAMMRQLMMFTATTMTTTMPTSSALLQLHGTSSNSSCVSISNSGRSSGSGSRSSDTAVEMLGFGEVVVFLRSSERKAAAAPLVDCNVSAGATAFEADADDAAVTAAIECAVEYHQLHHCTETKSLLAASSLQQQLQEQKQHQPQQQQQPRLSNSSVVSSTGEILSNCLVILNSDNAIVWGAAVVAALFILINIIGTSSLTALLQLISSAATLVAAAVYIREAPERRLQRQILLLKAVEQPQQQQQQHHQQYHQPHQQYHHQQQQQQQQEQQQQQQQHFSSARLLSLQALAAEGASLRGMNFHSIDLAGVQLQRADLRQSLFEHVNLQHADLTNANLESSRLTRVCFTGACLRSCNLAFTSCEGADFSAADLSDANFLCADLSGAKFTGTNVQRANFRGANLCGAVDLHLPATAAAAISTSISTAGIATIDTAITTFTATTMDNDSTSNGQGDLKQSPHNP